MPLFEKISNDIKEAMLARDKVRLEALRGAKKEFLEAKTAKGSNGELEDEQAMKIIQKMIKQRKDSAEIYKTNGRPEMAETELAEASVLEGYLPKQLSKEELVPKIKELIERLGVTDPKMMGKVMGAASKELQGQAEGKLIADVVKELLNS
ncbi:GatB/YqeY domain-containing protein [Porphyromonas pogonae]|uniref:GatB/YqeY domain-containing protein n=1 Tax=Porphyromonas pogonae TaxID=867595 RepID=UPI002E7A1D3D|nr:GatB/YqeY domain-containing protein [Porphyromonas pogonae]